MNNNFLKVENLVAGYKNGFKLKNISFSIKKSSFTGIIGPNGSGKSTLLKTIAGILFQENGRIFLENRELNSMTEKEKSKKIAYVPQFIENKDFKVFDYVLMGRFPYFESFQVFESKEDIEIAEKYMKILGIYNLKEKFLYELSGGQQQIVAICSALVQQPKLLLLDEPTAHLDLKYQVEILDLLYTLHEESELTIITVFHDLNLASEYCDYLILLKNGKIFSQGEPENVIDYKIIEEVYKIVVIKQENPISKKPFIIPVSKKLTKKIK